MTTLETLRKRDTTERQGKVVRRDDAFTRHHRHRRRLLPRYTLPSAPAQIGVMCTYT